MTPLEIYCDEAGFTGENLLNPSQRYFGYGSVAISAADASDLVSRTMRDFKLQGPELKGKNLLKYARGRKAIVSVINELGSNAQVVIADKEFVLACKLHEYGFEPLFTNVSTGLYAVDFHRFIANLVYFARKAHHPRALILSERFEKAVRGDDGPLRDLLSVHVADTRDPIEAVISFCTFNRDTILNELTDTKAGLKWILDVTGTSLNSILIAWGKRAQSLQVTCDESGPLSAGVEVLNMWVGRTERPTIQLGDREVQFGYTLESPIAFGKSHQTPGIQLADVVASAGVAAMDSTDDWATEMRKLLIGSEIVNADSVLPFREYVDMDLPEPQRNAAILMELLRRSEQDESLTNGLIEFVVNVSRGLRLPLPTIRFSE
jgi:hypothetical protein